MPFGADRATGATVLMPGCVRPIMGKKTVLALAVLALVAVLAYKIATR